MAGSGLRAILIHTALIHSLFIVTSEPAEPGADPEIEEGGGIHMNWCGARRTQLSVRALASFPGLRAFVACSTSLHVACSTSLKSLRTRLRI